MTYSLWLCPVPGSAVSERIQAEIEFWRKTGEGVAFEPHVTLLGGIACSEEEAVQKAKELAPSLSGTYLQFADVEAGASFHQCVYLRCNRERAVMQNAARARAHFGMPAPASPYLPHCSLLYSDIEAEKRQAIVRGAADRLYGNMKGYASLLVETGFLAESLQVWATPAEDKALESWRAVASFPLVRSD